ncbi:hypothetical protein C8R43DRAFT_952754 [Mycena crocata]|nr:hypothetical protein C8R43DRAFT_952754 [Mycena crocata]
MSQTQTETTRTVQAHGHSGRQDAKLVPGQPKLETPQKENIGALTSQPFPSVWLTASDDPVIAEAQWGQLESNHFDIPKNWLAATALRNKPSTKGEHRPAQLSVVLRFYFGLQGCILPIGFWVGSQAKMLAFMIAGPCDSEGKKPAYFIDFHPGSIEQDILQQFPMRFSSISDFHSGATELLMKRGYDSEMIKIVPAGSPVKFKVVYGNLWPRRHGGYDEAKDPNFDYKELLREMYPSGVGAQ